MRVTFVARSLLLLLLLLLIWLVWLVWLVSGHVVGGVVVVVPVVVASGVVG